MKKDQKHERVESKEKTGKPQPQQPPPIPLKVQLTEILGYIRETIEGGPFPELAWRLRELSEKHEEHFQREVRGTVALFAALKKLQETHQATNVEQQACLNELRAEIKKMQDALDKRTEPSTTSPSSADATPAPAQTPLPVTGLPIFPNIPPAPQAAANADPKKTQPHPWIPLAAAAALCILFGGGWFLKTFSQREHVNAALVANAVMRTPTPPAPILPPRPIAPQPPVLPAIPVQPQQPPDPPVDQRVTPCPQCESPHNRLANNRARNGHVQTPTGSGIIFTPPPPATAEPDAIHQPELPCPLEIIRIVQNDPGDPRGAEQYQAYVRQHPVPEASPEYNRRQAVLRNLNRARTLLASSDATPVLPR